MTGRQGRLTLCLRYSLLLVLAGGCDRDSGAGALGQVPKSSPTSRPMADQLKILQTSTDPAALESAGCALASSNDPQAIKQLCDFLRRAEFLARLDDLSQPQTKTQHLRRVMDALAANPSATTASACVALGRDRAFMRDPDRKAFLLVAIAAVAPMSEESAAFIAEANHDGYFAVNAPLLVNNASPKALALFAQMINDRNVTAERRIDSLHTSLPTRRTDLAVLQTCEKLASDKNLEPAVAIGVIESIFDFQPRKWFGTHPPRPAEWNTASQDSMRLALRMAESAKARADLPPALKQAIDQTAQAITEALTARGKP